jgi:hypothetical protein
MELLTLLRSDLRRAYDEINDKFDGIEKSAKREFFKKTRGRSS